MKASNPQKMMHKATNIFTDREEPRAAFWNLYHALEPDEIEIIHYYGVGGIGKSSLLKQLQLELTEYGNEKYIEYNFESKKAKDMVLYDLSRQMMRKCKGLRFPVFDYAFEKYKVLVGEEYLKYQLIDKENIFDHHLVGSAFSVVGDYVPFVGTVSSVVTEGSKAIVKIAKKHEQLRGEKADLYHEISGINSAQILFGKLQHYFAIDAFSYFDGRNEKPLVVMLDGYEVLVNKLERGQKAVNDDLWLREEGSLIMSIPNAIWVIAGREKLEWSTDILPQENTHLIGDLSVVDASRFFEESGINDDALISGLCTLTNGTPIYMDFCVKQYRKLKEQKVCYVPKLDDFGENTEEIAVRFLRDMTIMEQGILYLLSCMPNTWNDYCVMELAKRLHYDFSQNEYRLIKEMTFVEAVDSEGEFYRLHETFRKIVYSEIRKEEKKRILNGLKDILLARIVQANATQSDIQYTFYAMLNLFKTEFDKLELSFEDVKKITWAGLRCIVHDIENMESMRILEDKFLSSKEADALKKYVRCAEMHARGLNYFEKDQEAFELSKEVIAQLDATETVDAETKARGCGLYGRQLFLLDKYRESLSMLEHAYMSVREDSNVSYECKKNVFDTYLQVIYRYCEDNGKYKEIAKEYIEICKAEMVRLTNVKEEANNLKKINRVRSDEAETLVKIDCYEEALELYQLIYDTYKNAGVSEVKLCEYKMEMSDIYFYMKKHDETLQLLFQINEVYQQIGADAYDYNVLYGNIRDCYFDKREYDKAFEYGLKALEMGKKEYGDNTLSVAEEEMHLADISRLQEDYKNAEYYYMDCIRIKSNLLGENNSETLGAEELLATLYNVCGESEKAQDIWERLLVSYKELYGESHKRTLYALFRTGDYFYLNRDYEKAREIEEQAYRGLLEKVNREEMEIVFAARDLGNTCYVIGDFEAARSYAEKALSLLEDNLYVDVFDLYDSYQQCYRIYNALEEYAKALEVIEKCMVLIENNEELIGSQYWHTLNSLGDAYGANDNAEKALEIHKKVLAHYEESEETELEIDARLGVSIDLDALGKCEEALEMDRVNYDKAVRFFGEDTEEAMHYYDFVADDLETLGRLEEAESIRAYIKSKTSIQEI